MPYWTGKTLAEDLAKNPDQAKWMTWLEVPLGSVVWHDGRLPRADVLAIRKSFSSPSFIIYEVKVSRGDYNADVNRGKYRDYFPYCSQLYFATPKGLVAKQEVPEGAGLIVRGDNGWRVVKGAPRREHKLDEELLLKLLMRGYENRLVEWKQYDRLKNLEYKGLKEASYQHGIRIAHEIGHADDFIQEAQKVKERIEEALGVKYATIWNAVFSLRADVDRLLARRQYAEETRQLALIVDDILRGATHTIRNAPHTLRRIAEQFEEKYQKETAKTPE